MAGARRRSIQWPQWTALLLLAASVLANAQDWPANEEF